MTKEELKNSYAKQIEQATTELDKGLLRAELEHKIKMLDAGVNADEEREKASSFECIGCSA